MRSLCRLCLALCVSLPLAFSQNVGSGAANSLISTAFVTGFLRNNFQNLVSLPPVANVTALGTNGYVQQFHDVNSTPGVLYALILPNLTGSGQVYQSYPGVYALYQQVGVTTAGYPTSDTVACPVITGNSCTYQNFTSNYAMFAYTNAIAGSTAFFTRDPFYTLWQTYGGVAVVGPPASAETAFTSAAGNVATIQTYSAGLIANITSGTVTARTIAVKEPIWDLYSSNGGYTGIMGLPLTAELLQSNGHYRQSFEHGTVDYDPKNIPASVTLLAPVSNVQLAPAQPGGVLHMNLGDTVTLTATALGSDGSLLSGRLFTWTTTNGLVASITVNGSSAVVKAISGGAANITVSSEGITSPGLAVLVAAPCCTVGEGAPTTALAQSFQAAIARNHLTPVLPAANPVTRAGAGYVQQLQSADTGELFWLAASQTTGIAYWIHGAVLTEYIKDGGPAGELGYPSGDPLAGRQFFQGGALAGSPVVPVTGAILAKWAALGYDIAGNPTAAPAAFLTFAATTGTEQTFQNATIFAIVSGAQAGQSYSIAGPILAAYSGPSSDLGVPTDDESTINGVQHQDFEGGFMEYSPGDTVAQITAAPRVPTVTATPGVAPAGGVVRLSLGGFDNNAQVQVTVTGQPPFVTTVPTGAYIWESYVPSTAGNAAVTVTALDLNTQASTQASYSIRNATASQITVTALEGDQQTGLPGATLPIPIQVQLADSLGNPIPNAPVRFTPSPGGLIGADASVVTDANGIATAHWRLPTTAGLALLTVNANGHLASLSAAAAHASLQNFPTFAQSASAGPLLASAAAAIRYFQNRGQMPASNGLADPPALNAYLKTLCAPAPAACDSFLTPANAIDQIPNLWRVRGFVGNALDIHTIAATDAAVRDQLAQGDPVILALTLSNNGANFVVATGVDASGNLSIMDPAYGQTSLYSYLNGFRTSAGASLTGAITGAAAVAAQTPANSGFLVAVNSPTAVQSSGGSCGAPFSFPVSNGGTFTLHYCDAVLSAYELDMPSPDGASGFAGTLVDLSAAGTGSAFSGSGAASFLIANSTGPWTIGPLTVQFAAAGVVNSASGTNDVAPGGLASIMGIGFLSPGSQAPIVTVNGEAATVLNTTGFQIDLQIPVDAQPGAAVIDVTSDWNGTGEQTITLSPAAPAIARILNADGSVNSRYKPAARGTTVSILATGLGALTIPATATVGGVPLTVSPAKGVAGSPGLFQLNVSLPTSLAPGLALPVVLQQGDSASVAARIAIQ